MVHWNPASLLYRGHSLFPCSSIQRTLLLFFSPDLSKHALNLQGTLPFSSLFPLPQTPAEKRQRGFRSPRRSPPAPREKNLGSPLRRGGSSHCWEEEFFSPPLSCFENLPGVKLKVPGEEKPRLKSIVVGSGRVKGLWREDRRKG